MIHEVMVLDHSGPEFALITYGAALKFMLLGSILLHTAFPHIDLLDGWPVIFIVPLRIGALLALAAFVGTIESTMARLRLSRVPLLQAAATVLAGLAVLLVLLRRTT